MPYILTLNVNKTKNARNKMTEKISKGGEEYKYPHLGRI
jgi:hypothetical protein